jgi:hypothetical protein
LCWAAETTEARTKAEATNVVKKRMAIFLSKWADLEGRKRQIVQETIKTRTWKT